MKQIIDINNWKRKEHFHFFKNYQEPFYNLVANVDCTKAYHHAQKNNLSFFLYYLYQSLVAANRIEEFRYRIEDDNVVLYDKIHICTTAMNANNLFAFAFIPYADSLDEFYIPAQEEIAKIRSLATMNLDDERNARPDVIHYSTIPWVSFTGLTHARRVANLDSIPKLSFGKYFKEGGRMMLPVSVSGHHGLMDGSHVGEFFDGFQRLLDGEIK